MMPIPPAPVPTAAAGSPLRAALKWAAEYTVAASGVDRLAMALRRVGVLVLAYHNVVPAGDRPAGDRSLHLPQDAFARQLDELRRTHRIVPLESAFDAPVDGRPRAVVTFDDACRGAVTAGIDELARRGIPATFFVAPGLLGTVPWWDELSGPDGLDPAVRAHALDALGGRPDDVRAWAKAEGIARHAIPSSQRIATLDELGKAARERGVRLAAHGWSHARLDALAPAELEEELARPLAWLREHFPAATIPWLAYPYGLWSREVEEAAERAGYAGAFRVDGGRLPLVGAAPGFSLPRLNVPAGISDTGFRIRLAGLGGSER
ncbi:MAG TPA: polysaccharide deacetylase family protein [Longimicrobium sp.]|nr:polysaccharide deacetylase family protein [Longimicrobium sp.]